jgi:hypothetical protein
MSVDVGSVSAPPWRRCVLLVACGLVPLSDIRDRQLWARQHPPKSQNSARRSPLPLPQRGPFAKEDGEPVIDASGARIR